MPEFDSFGIIKSTLRSRSPCSTFVKRSSLFPLPGMLTSIPVPSFLVMVFGLTKSAVTDPAIDQFALGFLKAERSFNGTCAADRFCAPAKNGIQVANKSNCTGMHFSKYLFCINLNLMRQLKRNRTNWFNTNM